jgi:hypothetical protein
MQEYMDNKALDTAVMMYLQEVRGIPIAGVKSVRICGTGVPDKVEAIITLHDDVIARRMAGGGI